MWIKGKHKMLHRIIYQNRFGEIPKGMLVHHINGDIFDNRIENLQLVSKTEHERIHSPHYKTANGYWVKRCIRCKRMLPLGSFPWLHYPTSPIEGTPRSWCKQCEVKRVMRYYRRMKSHAS